MRQLTDGADVVRIFVRAAEPVFRLSTSAVVDVVKGAPASHFIGQVWITGLQTFALNCTTLSK